MSLQESTQVDQHQWHPDAASALRWLNGTLMQHPDSSTGRSKDTADQAKVAAVG